MLFAQLQKKQVSGQDEFQGKRGGAGNAPEVGKIDGGSREITNIPYPNKKKPAR
jgi:hypothetical protein